MLLVRVISDLACWNKSYVLSLYFVQNPCCRIRSNCFEIIHINKCVEIVEPSFLDVIFFFIYCLFFCVSPTTTKRRNRIIISANVKCEPCRRAVAFHFHSSGSFKYHLCFIITEKYLWKTWEWNFRLSCQSIDSRSVNAKGGLSSIDYRLSIDVVRWRD